MTGKMTCTNCSEVVNAIPLTFATIMKVNVVFHRTELQFQRGDLTVESTELSNAGAIIVKCPCCDSVAPLSELIKITYCCNGCGKSLDTPDPTGFYCRSIDRRYCKACFKKNVTGFCGLCSHKKSCSSERSEGRGNIPIYIRRVADANENAPRFRVNEVLLDE